MTFKLLIIVSVALATMQTAYLFIPANMVWLFDNGLRPLIYGFLAVTVYLFIGTDARPLPKANQVKIIAIISAILYGLVFILISYMFGIGVNVMAANPRIILWNFWQWGSVVFFGEMIRYKLIKSSKNRYRGTTVLILTLVLAYAQLNDLRSIIHMEIASPSIIFSSIFPAIVISAITSYYAIEGGLISVLLIRGVYTLVPWVSPVLPQVERITWALIVSFLAFFSFLLLHYAVGDKKSRLRAKRRARVEKKPLRYHAFYLIVIGVLMAFFMRLLPYYPVVVLSESMTGTLNRGSLVFVERVPTGEAYTRVGEGEIIHFNHGGLDFVHRVIEFRHDSDGVREYITKGDANEIADPFPVAQGDVYGIARFYLPFIGYPVVLIHGIFGWRL